jgi:transcriptional regulator with XRE-family HTH domain
MLKRKTILKRFGFIVKTQRVRMGMTQQEFAERVGIHRTYVGAIERGERNITIGKLCQIAEALHGDLRNIWNDIII